MAIGSIFFINIDQSFGFIVSPDIQLDHIYFQKCNCNNNYKYLQKDDKITFDLVTNEDDQKEAINIKFIQNENLDRLRKAFKEKFLFKGYLKRIENYYYYVQDIETSIFIQISISDNEINIKENYEDNLNKLIDYQIISISKSNKIKAIIPNRDFLPEIDLIKENVSIEGVVIARIKRRLHHKSL